MDGNEEHGHPGYLTRTVFDAAFTFSKTAAGSPAQEKELLFSALMTGVRSRRDHYIERLNVSNEEYLLRAKNAELAAAQARNEAQMQISEVRVGEGKREFTFLEMEAALCVWEWMLDEGASRVEAWRDACGTVELRHASYSIGRYCLKIFEEGKRLAGEEAWAEVPYDWEVIPAICELLEYDPGFGWIMPCSDEDAARQALKRIGAFRDREACHCAADDGRPCDPDCNVNPNDAAPDALAALVLEMAEAIDAAADDVGTGSRGPLIVLREAVQIAQAMKTPKIKNDPANYKTIGMVQDELRRDYLQKRATETSNTADRVPALSRKLADVVMQMVDRGSIPATRTPDDVEREAIALAKAIKSGTWATALVPTDAMIEAASGEYWRNHWPNYFTENAKKAIRETMGRALRAAWTAGGDFRRVLHRERGSTYAVLGEAQFQVSTPFRDPDHFLTGQKARIVYDYTKVTAYVAQEDGKLWLRFPDEFEDGRFEDVASAPRT